MNIWLLKNSIKPYAWGSKTAIPSILGYPEPYETPAAELWMGVHPKGPSSVCMNESWAALETVIRQNPEELLGASAAAVFRQLPFLFKILAAEYPLSIQAHPDAERASEGFMRENQQGIPLTDDVRNYKDANHKPELLCALTPFSMMCGFRPIQEIIDEFSVSCGDEIQEELAAFQSSRHPEGLRRFYQSIMTLTSERRRQIIMRVCQGNRRDVYNWINSLAKDYPDDIGVLSPLLMNCIQLKPGQAVFLPSGVLHGYVKGTGIELMANSDNVIRGGLTSKHVDVPELLNTVTFSDTPLPILEPKPISEIESVYVTPAREFMLSVIYLKDGFRYENSLQSCEILICLSGSGRIYEKDEFLSFSKGNSLFISAGAKRYSIVGDAELYKASIPL